MGIINIQNIKSKKNITPIFLIVTLVLSVVASLCSSYIKVSAIDPDARLGSIFLTKNSDYSLENQSLSMQYFFSISMCLHFAMSKEDGKSAAGSKKDSFIVSGAKIEPTYSQVFPIANEAKVFINGSATTCAAVLEKALKLWGWNGPADTYVSEFALKSLGCTKYGNGYKCAGDDSGRVKSFRVSLSSVFSDFNKILSDAGLYVFYRTLFSGPCKGQFFGTKEEIAKKDIENGESTAGRFDTGWIEAADNTPANPDRIYTYINTPAGNTGGIIKIGATYDQILESTYDDMSAYPNKPIPIYGKAAISTKTPDSVDTIKEYTGITPQAQTVSQCQSIVIELNNKAQAYARYLEANPLIAPIPTVLSNVSPATKTPQTATGDANEVASCGNQAGPMGWVACPLMSTLETFNQGAWMLFEGLFKVEPLATNFPPAQGGGETPVYQAWGIMRNISNILFVIMFLVLIFSQITNIGIDNYGIKKLLPKIIVGAILINTSFLVMQLLFDVTNIIGAGIYDFLAKQIITGTNAPSPSVLFQEILGLALAGGIVVGGVAVLGGAAAALWMMLPILFGAALALLAAILTLVFRLAIIPMLAIVAPLAFAAYLMPNASSLFKKWKDALTSMLMIYPLAAILFGGSLLVSQILAGSGFWAKLLAYIVLIMPLGALPFIVSKSGAIVGAASGFLTGLAAKAKKPMEGYAGGKRDTAKARSDEEILKDPNKGGLFTSLRRRQLTRKLADDGSKKEAERNLALQGSKNLATRLKDDPKFLKRYAGSDPANQEKALNSARSTLKELESSDLKAATDAMELNNDNPTTAVANLGLELENALKSGDVLKARAARAVLATKGGAGIGMIQTSIENAEKSPEGVRLNSDQLGKFKNDIAGSGMKGQNAILDKYSTTTNDMRTTARSRDTFKDLSDADMATQSEVSLQAALDTGALTSAQAARILDEDPSNTLRNGVKPKSRAVLERARGSTTP